MLVRPSPQKREETTIMRSPLAHESHHLHFFETGRGTFTCPDA